jgi:hypothetical protein
MLNHFPFIDTPEAPTPEFADFRTSQTTTTRKPAGFGLNLVNAGAKSNSR